MTVKVTGMKERQALHEGIDWPQKRFIRLRVNGRLQEGFVDPRKLLVDYLREDLGLTGTHVGCEHGVCGSCNVLFNGRPIRSCLMFAVQADGAEVVTIEGISQQGRLNEVQEALVEEHGLQCGFCTAGIVLMAMDLLSQNPSPTDWEIREALSGQLCRCTGYESIVRAVLRAAKSRG